MSQGVHEANPPKAWVAPDDYLSLCAGSIDTASVNLDAAVVSTMADPMARRARIETVDVESEMAASPETHPNASVGVEEPPPMEGGVRRSRTFAPLAAIAPVKAMPHGKTVIEQLRIPKVVEQVLTDVPEHWQLLSRGVQSRVEQDGLGTLLVTSAVAGEGTTTVATALAVSVVRNSGLKVLLLDADFAHPCMADLLQIKARIGIEHYLLENADLEETIVTCEQPKLDILPTLEPFEMPSIAMGSERLVHAIDYVREIYDLVILDCGAILADRRPKPLPAGIDASLIVRDPSKSSGALLDQTDAYLARLGICSLGVIENCVET